MKSYDHRPCDYPYSNVRAALSVRSCHSSGADSNGEALLSAIGPLYAVFKLLTATLGVVTGAYKISPTLDYFQPARSNTISAAA
jgi:hypothetical protein